MKQGFGRLTIGAVAVIVLLPACGGTSQRASGSSPSVSAAPSSPTPTPSASPIPAAADMRIVIEDYTGVQVRLARLDATDVAAVTGRFDGIVGGQVIILNGSTLEALSRTGAVTTLGRLASTPDWNGVGTVAVKPDLTQWLYSIVDSTNWTATIHLGSSTGDQVVTTLPSPDGYAFYTPFAWNTSGVYLVRQATGLGGAGPFLEYHFPLARIDPTNGTFADVSPACVAYDVLDDGTMLCGHQATGGIEVRPPAGTSTLIQLAKGGSGSDLSFSKVAVSPDGRRLVAGRNGSTDPVINYQMAEADLSSPNASTVGQIDFVPDAWLPDGRLVADHACVSADFGGGACDASLDGTYIFSADGTTHTFFYKIVRGAVVGAF